MHPNPVVFSLLPSIEIPHGYSIDRAIGYDTRAVEVCISPLKLMLMFVHVLATFSFLSFFFSLSCSFPIIANARA
jgi:hypothetical protein